MKVKKMSKEEKAKVTPDRFLELHGKNVGKVFAVWSAGDSDFGYETILYLTPKNKPKTAVVYGERLVVQDGWDWFNLNYTYD